jgi:hypothetical protein
LAISSLPSYIGFNLNTKKIGDSLLDQNWLTSDKLSKKSPFNRTAIFVVDKTGYRSMFETFGNPFNFIPWVTAQPTIFFFNIEGFFLLTISYSTLKFTSI